MAHQSLLPQADVLQMEERPCRNGIARNSSTDATVNNIDLREVQFNGLKKKAKCALAPVATTEDDLWDLLTEKWRLHHPCTVLSVIGNEENFKMDPDLIKEFKEGLEKTAKSTNAWIISGGMHCGVSKHVGNAVAKLQHIVSLGVSCLERIADRNEFLNGNCQNYNCVEKNSLHHNHTHFILQKESDQCLELRQKLEKHIIMTIPNVQMVYLLIHGDNSSTLEAVYKILTNENSKILVVVLGQSGGWASIISELCDVDLDRISEDLISQLMKKNDCYASESDIDKLSILTNQARECRKKIQQIKVFNQHHLDSLDNIILKALLDANSIGIEKKLESTLKWNRPDIAESLILSKCDDQNMDKIFHTTFVAAIKEDKSDFLKVLLDHGPSFCEKFSQEELIELYGEKKVKEEKNLYLGSLFESRVRCQGLSFIEDFHEMGIQGVLRELFFFSLTNNKRACAKVIWDAMTEETLPTALVAVRILKKVLKKSNNKSQEEKGDIMMHMNTYKQLSNDILNKCFEQDAEKTMLLLRRRLKPWGTLTCLQIAAEAKDKDLLSHSAAQHFLSQIWFGELSKHKPSIPRAIWFSVCICFAAITLFFSPLLFKFQKIPEKNSDPAKREKDSDQAERGKNLRERDYSEKVKSFYCTPLVKFHIVMMFHVVFLILFGYILLFNFFDALNQWEIVLVVWVVFLMIEELRQISDFPYEDYKKKIKFWWKQSGNKLDILSFVFYFIGFGLRLFSPLMEAARVFFCLSFIVFSLRLLGMFTVNKELGPKLVMVQKMMKDLFFFVFILLVFLIAYGVASQSLLYPNETNVGHVFGGIFSVPYWNIFGELFLPEIVFNPTTEDFHCTTNETLHEQGYRRCPSGSRVVPIIAGFYLLMANVLLLNLLIAMFSYTFERLVEQTDKIWKYQRYFLVKDYYLRSAIVVPFSFIPFFLGFLQRKNIKKTSGLEEDLADETEKDLKKWEWKCTKIVLDENCNKKEPVHKMNERLKKLENVVIDVQKKFEGQRSTSEQHIQSMETKLNDSLQWIISALLQNDIVPTDVSIPVHKKARSSPYPKCGNVERFLFKDHMVPWNVPLFGYDPPSYTDSEVLNNRDGADPPHGYNLRFNEFDEIRKVQRTSYIGRYQVINGMPRNPRGRTGLTGRGRLRRFGPNHAANFIMTAWERDENEQVVMENGKKVIVFVAVQRADTEEWAIPGGVDDECGIRGLLPGDRLESNETPNAFFQRVGKEVYRGYCDDPRNTDNAWVETIVYNFHIEDANLFKELDFSEYDESIVKIERAIVYKSMSLYADHMRYIEMVAKAHNANFEEIETVPPTEPPNTGTAPPTEPPNTGTAPSTEPPNTGTAPPTEPPNTGTAPPTESARASPTN